VIQEAGCKQSVEYVRIHISKVYPCGAAAAFDTSLRMSMHDSGFSTKQALFG
jgi:hypothetical protein